LVSIRATELHGELEISYRFHIARSYQRANKKINPGVVHLVSIDTTILVNNSRKRKYIAAPF